MASQAQYACFKEIFEREEARYDRLVQRATLYLSVITLYFGLLAVAADEVVPALTTSWAATGAYLASFGAFVVSLTLVVLAAGIYSYVYPTNPETVILAMGEGWPTDADFYDERIAELAAAFKTNHPVNERRANLLKFSSFAMLVGIGCQAVVLSLLLFIRQ